MFTCTCQFHDRDSLMSIPGSIDSDHKAVESSASNTSCSEELSIEDIAGNPSCSEELAIGDTSSDGSETLNEDDRLAMKLIERVYKNRPVARSKRVRLICFILKC